MPATTLAARTCERYGVEQERRTDRAEAVLAGHEQHPGKCGEHAGETAHAQQLTLVLFARKPAWVGEQPGEQREEQDQRDHPEDQPDRGPGRANLQQLCPDLRDHAGASEVSSRKMSSSKPASLTSS